MEDVYQYRRAAEAIDLMEESQSYGKVESVVAQKKLIEDNQSTRKGDPNWKTQRQTCKNAHNSALPEHLANSPY